MKCHVCGSEMVPMATDLPFKLSDTTIVIVKGLPVLQCSGCSEYALEDSVMQQVEKILDEAAGRAELEVVRFAA
ncbi:MAG TPA: YgiT-type zinc finger protein [Thermoanaerobaculia bacterium]|nr:YgiT-type zinc finger protein [Thermoanaerobaculia bacterium]